ncbi:hypothetical protein [Mycolicibacterium tusciae]|uniref:Cytochrome P450 n=1 Tax=Mycolicibacterium tusciae TaxID=75922 RepID=A0A1X0JIU4_9MYCO|nr:hypothetical protein [Mycolicibacterium tusciae]ORB62744.1 hypothetical protein BST47_22370 [Mycolicibacterium tusciae]
MTNSLEEHAQNWDLRHEDFKDKDFLYDVYSVIRQAAPFAYTDTPSRCLGSNLARVEFRIGLGQVLSSLPDYVLAPGAEAAVHGNSLTRGFLTIPVIFTPGEKSI